LLKEYEIAVVPVGLVIDGKLYRDQVDITAAQFWSMFTDLTEQPTTAATSPGEFVDVFTELGKTTDSIICILVSKALTATQESAFQARRLVKSKKPDINIEVLDSKTSAGALGFIVLEAARAAQENKSLEEVVDIVQDMISRVIYVAALDTLKYLIKIGRAPKTTTGIGELLQVKPIIGFVDDTGLLDMLGRVRGKHKAMTKLVDLVKEYIDTDTPVHIMVHYSNCFEDGEELREIITSKYNCAELYMTEYTPVMVSATGPMIGLAFYS